MSNEIINIFSKIEIISWGELYNKEEFKKICPKITEAQKEEWKCQSDFFNQIINNCDSKYYLLIDDKSKIISSQFLTIKSISIFENNPIISFIYFDYNDILLPSFKPSIFKNTIIANIPIFIRNLKNKINIDKKDNNYLSNLIQVLSTNFIGYHVPKTLVQIYE